MKKRILAFLISALIVTLSGCSGTKSPKPVENKDEFFSRITGIYTDLSYYDEYYNTSFQILKDGTFLIYNKRLIGESTINKGYFQTIYINDELSYHASISKLASHASIGEFTDSIKINFNPVQNHDDPIETDRYNAKDICSNDRFDIYYPGSSTDYLPALDKYTKEFSKDENGDLTGYNVYDYDKNLDNKLDYYLIYNNETDHVYKEISSNYIIDSGIWVDYTSEAPIIKVYDCEKGNVEVTRYSLSDDSITEYESQRKSEDPYYYIAIESSIIMINDKEETYISVVPDQNTLRVSTNSSNTGIKNDYFLYFYDKLPDYNTLVKDSAKAVSNQKQLNN